MSNLDNRRPIATRGAKFVQILAKKLGQSKITPNQISMASVGFAALAGLCFWLSRGEYMIGLLLGAFFIQMRLLCNLLDGLVAVEWNKSQKDGAFWNEAPDRYADILILAGIGYGLSAPALGWAAACVSVLVAYTRELGSAQGFKADFSGPFAKQHRMALVTATSLIAIFVPSLFGVPLMELALYILILGSLLTALKRSKTLIKNLSHS